MPVESERVRVGTVFFVVRKRCRGGSPCRASIWRTFGEARRHADQLIAEDRPNDCDAEPPTLSVAIVHAIDVVADVIRCVFDEVALV